MGKRSRRRAGERRGSSSGLAGQLPDGLGPLAATSIYSDSDGGELELRRALTPRARAEYAATRTGGAHREDAWQRATELLFERLAVAWTIAGVRTDTQRELLGRYRMAGVAERRFVRESLRAHLKDNFPELEAP